MPRYVRMEVCRCCRIRGRRAVLRAVRLSEFGVVFTFQQFKIPEC